MNEIVRNMQDKWSISRAYWMEFVLINIDYIIVRYEFPTVFIFENY